MGIFLIVLLFVLLFWGSLKNLRKSSEIYSLGTVAVATKYTAANVKDVSDADIKKVQDLRSI